MNDDLKELRDNYLISLGASLGNTYTFINTDGFKLQTEEIEEEVHIGNVTI